MIKENNPLSLELILVNDLYKKGYSEFIIPICEEMNRDCNSKINLLKIRKYLNVYCPQVNSFNRTYNKPKEGRVYREDGTWFNPKTCEHGYWSKERNEVYLLEENSNSKKLKLEINLKRLRENVKSGKVVLVNDSRRY
jgi:hypothetical protein